MRALVLCGLAPVLFAFLPASAQEREAPPRLPEIRVIPPSAPGALPPSSTPSRVDTLTGPEIRRDAPAVKFRRGWRRASLSGSEPACLILSWLH